MLKLTCSAPSPSVCFVLDFWAVHYLLCERDSYADCVGIHETCRRCTEKIMMMRQAGNQYMTYL
jgi:hypothetical protein